MRITVEETLAVKIPIDPDLLVTVDVKEGSFPREEVRDRIGIEPMIMQGHAMIRAGARDAARVLAMIDPEAGPITVLDKGHFPAGEVLARAVAEALAGRSLAEAQVKFVNPINPGLVEGAGQVRLTTSVIVDVSYEFDGSSLAH
ncbi:hypothetical protein [Microbacterium thalassium]|uniref:Uncharacterized protein n=1 Tax=Microbacterium thalassium TaxID=362649 RepID=A0A7X0KTJ8_9MICO|nr:hypothetical protein [Microbacterium thalassium]MBB6390210.1 hypothetical protein [Microbacterium thalassium]GLK25318.1 hypothetical protein GCM10017607_26370 [Microbacterium thalassium]